MMTQQKMSSAEPTVGPEAHVDPVRLVREMHHLQHVGFLSAHDKAEDVLLKGYSYEGWAEAFWRMRTMYATRSDPEIEAVVSLSPVTHILEVGGGLWPLYMQAYPRTPPRQGRSSSHYSR